MIIAELPSKTLKAIANSSDNFLISNDKVKLKEENFIEFVDFCGKMDAEKIILRFGEGDSYARIVVPDSSKFAKENEITEILLKVDQPQDRYTELIKLGNRTADNQIKIQKEGIDNFFRFVYVNRIDRGVLNYANGIALIQVPLPPIVPENGESQNTKRPPSHERDNGTDTNVSLT